MVMLSRSDLQTYIRSIQDFPKKGIVFRDITTLLMDKNAFSASIRLFNERYSNAGITKVVSVESRGFIFGSALAYAMGAGFVPVRKPKKLPAQTIREDYQLEYGTDALEIHVDAISEKDNVLIVDDLLATGGTILAACALVRRLHGTIHGLAFLIELSFLGGRKRLGNYDVFSLITYDQE
jgi:adenine phosphoribosyltransferase